MRKTGKGRVLAAAVLVLAVMALFTVTAFAAETEGEAATPAMYGTFWSLIPPIVAIALALITKEF